MPDDDQDLPYDDHAPLLGEVVTDPLAAVTASAPERRGNLVYHEIELHSGPYARTIARFCQVYRHSTHEYRHTSVEFFHFKRPNQHAGFAIDRKFALDGAALEAFVAATHAIPRLQMIGEAASSIVVPMTQSTHDDAPDDFNSIVSGLSTRQE